MMKIFAAKRFTIRLLLINANHRAVDAQGLVVPACYSLLFANFHRERAVAIFPFLSAGAQVR